MLADSIVYVDLNPRDEVPHVLGLIVSHPTGVVYGNQAGGLACMWRSMEGYLVVLGAGSTAASYIDFFRRFEGRPPSSGSSWKGDDLTELSILISSTVRYARTNQTGFGEVEVAVGLDKSRTDELTEGWIPVAVGDGRGVLVFPNSD